MKLTVEDCLRLPTLTNAKVVAGTKGLKSEVKSITVIEFTEDFGIINTPHELAITAFHAFRYNIERQCKTLRHLKTSGDVGLIIFYSDLILKGVDDKLLQTADELDFPLILLPGEDWGLAYSDVIKEVMDAVISTTRLGRSHIYNTIKKISEMKQGERTINKVLEIAGSLTGTNLMLCDRQYNLLAKTFYTSKNSINLNDILAKLRDQKELSLSTQTEIGRIYSFHFFIQENTHLILLATGSNFDIFTLSDIAEIVRLFSAIWDYDLTLSSKESIIPTLLEGRTLQIKSISTKYSIDISRYTSVIYLTLESDSSLIAMRKLAEEYDQFSVVDSFNDCIVVFTSLNLKSTIGQLYLDTLFSNFGGIIAYFVLHDIIKDSNKTYALYCNYIDSVKKIYPHERLLSGDKFQIAYRCCCFANDSEREYYNDLLKPIINNQDSELLTTLACYLLDCDGEIKSTSKFMHLHRNTVLYRVKKIESLLGQVVNKMPLALDLYLAVAIERLSKII